MLVHDWKLVHLFSYIAALIQMWCVCSDLIIRWCALAVRQSFDSSCKVHRYYMTR